MPPAPSARALHCLPLAGLMLLSGCAGGAAAGLANAALQLAGLARPAPALPEAQQPPRKIQLRLHAGQRLNTDERGQSLALVARIYQLRQRAAFEQAPYDSFLDAQKEKAVLGADLLGVREVLLVPGQRHEVQELVSREAGYIGVVALFRAPAAQRWRATFAATAAEADGMTVGLHGCALSIGSAALAPCPQN